MSIGENIKHIRKEKGLTQRELGIRLGGISQQQIGQWENGDKNPKLETLQKIADALEVPLIQIMDFIPLEQYKTTDEYKKTLIKVSAYEGILAILKHIYGNIEEKSVQSKYGESIYYLTGKGNDRFVLYEGNIEKLLNFVIKTFPFLVDEMKDTQSEQEIVDGIKADLNSPEWIAKVKQFISEQEKPIQN